MKFVFPLVLGLLGSTRMGSARSRSGVRVTSYTLNGDGADVWSSREQVYDDLRGHDC